VTVPSKKPNPAKRGFLRQHGVLNSSPARVADPLFQDSEFFDSQDLVQLKYEMLRRVEIDNQSVSQSASSFGFSRPTFYQAQADFQERGLAGLIPDKRGPRAAHKLTSEVLSFVQQLRVAQPSWRASELAAAIAERFGVTVHPRSIERSLLRQQKKRR
jgi:transposase